MSIALRTVGKLDLRWGYFFSLHVTGDSEYRDLLAASSERELISGPVVDSERCLRGSAVVGVSAQETPEDDEWPDIFEQPPLLVDLDEGDQPHPLLPLDNAQGLFRADIAAALMASDFSGCSWRAVSFRRINVPLKRERIPKYYSLRTSGRRADVVARVVPDTANRCPQCGFQPVHCPRRDNAWRTDCPNCGTRCIVPEKEHGGPGDPRICISLDEPSALMAIDAVRWQGDDFFHSGMVTARVVDTLRQLGAAPFVAQPVPVNIASAFAEEISYLEQARRPLKP
jgi:hypothetical protein